MPTNYNILVIGSVGSTVETINGLVRNDLKPCGILGYMPDNVENVSSWRNLAKVADNYDVPFKSFKKISDTENVKWAKEKKPDIIFAVGFSQLLNDKWLNLPKLGCVGFHPTLLPKGRGRAPLAWLILEEESNGAVTFFKMGRDADDGPIFIQIEFHINQHDTVRDIADKVLENIGFALDEWLPKLRMGIWDPKPQNHNEASWYGKREPDDGVIDWAQTASAIDRKIRATTKPYPGAFTFLNNEKVIVWSSEIEKNLNYTGVTGKILLVEQNKGVLVQCGTGLIWLKDLSKAIGSLRIGQKLGYDTQIEIHKIWKQLSKLENE